MSYGWTVLLSGLMDKQFAHVQVLLETKRYQDAEAKLREALLADPDDARSHALLSYVLYLQDREAEALQEAEAAIGLAPNDPSNHYYRALVLLSLGRLDAAMLAAREAVRLDPEWAQYRAIVSRIHLRKKAWKKALRAAEEGLRLDPENVSCINLRALALIGLGQKDEADRALASALARDPENATTHASQGWALLNRGDHEGALVHFRESLRLNPLSDWARQGIVEALKARSVVYRLILRYFLWMSRLTSEDQMGVVGILSGVKTALRVAARAFPPLYIVVLPLFLLYFIFAMLTWTARPLFALVLRLDRFGRLALPREEIVASNWVGACLLVGLAGVILGPVSGVAFWLLFENIQTAGFIALAFLILAVAALAMIVPVAGVFRCRRGVGRVFLAVYTILLALAGLVAFALALIGPVGLALAVVPAIVFGVGWLAYSWIASLVILLSSGIS